MVTDALESLLTESSAARLLLSSDPIEARRVCAGFRRRLIDVHERVAENGLPPEEADRIRSCCVALDVAWTQYERGSTGKLVYSVIRPGPAGMPHYVRACITDGRTS